MRTVSNPGLSASGERVHPRVADGQGDEDLCRGADEAGSGIRGTGKTGYGEWVIACFLLVLHGKLGKQTRA